MKKRKKVVALMLVMLVLFGSFRGISAQAKECSAHGVSVCEYGSSSTPVSMKHELYEYDVETNTYVFLGMCTYYRQYHTVRVVCRECNQEVTSYTYFTEWHTDSQCSEYGN